MAEIRFVVSCKSIKNARPMNCVQMKQISGKGPEGNHGKEKFEMTQLEQLWMWGRMY
jgi:hypothetical protein